MREKYWKIVDGLLPEYCFLKVLKTAELICASKSSGENAVPPETHSIALFTCAMQSYLEVI